MASPAEPHCIEAEQAVIGAVLIDNDAWPAVSHLTAGDFYREDHRAIYAALAELAEDGQMIDPVTVAECLDAAGKLYHAGGLAYVADLAENTPSAANAGAYARIVQEHTERRQLLGIANELSVAAGRVGTGREPVRAVVNRIAGALQEVAEHVGGTPARRAVPVPDVKVDFPARRLWAAGCSGAVLSTGTVALLAGEGGIGKSPLTGSIALGVAMLPDGQSGDVSGRLFEGEGGPVLMATLEDDPGVTAWRLRKLAGNLDAGNGTAASNALLRVHVLDLTGRPLFGPRDDGHGALYGARPERLAGWWDLWREVDRIGARLVMVDPVLSAYVGEPNAAAPVTEFLVALAGEAKARSVGVLMAAHSTKVARKGEGKDKRKDPFDPGQVSGTAAWTDRVRGVLSFTWGDDSGARVLAVSKANYGPARIQIPLEPIRDKQQAICGFRAPAGALWTGGAARAPAGTGRNRPPPV